MQRQLQMNITLTKAHKWKSSDLCLLLTSTADIPSMLFDSNLPVNHTITAVTILPEKSEYKLKNLKGTVD